VIEFIAFLFYKLVAILGMVIVWGWVPFLSFVAFMVGKEECSTTFWRRFWMIGAVVVGSMGSITYWNSIWPGPVRPNMGPLDSLFHYTLLTPTERLKQVEEQKPPTVKELGTELRRYRLDGWAPPKHFYVDLTDLKTGAKHDQVYVSKHCNNAGSLRRGDEYNILLRRYELSNQPGVVRYEFANLYETFC